MRLAEKIRI